MDGKVPEPFDGICHGIGIGYRERQVEPAINPEQGVAGIQDAGSRMIQGHVMPGMAGNTDCGPVVKSRQPAFMEEICGRLHLALIPDGFDRRPAQIDHHIAQADIDFVLDEPPGTGIPPVDTGGCGNGDPFFSEKIR